MGGEGKLRVLTAWDHKVSLERTSYRVLESTSQIAAEMFPILSRQQTHIGGSLVNRYEWVYSPASQHTTTHGMKVRLPGAENLSNYEEIGAYIPAVASFCLCANEFQSHNSSLYSLQRLLSTEI